MADSRITAKEYERIVKRLEFNLATRTNLLTLSFTTVFALLAIALTAEPEKINSFIFIMPFFLIIPFAARITYYRIIYARMYAFLMTFAPDDMQFAIIGKQVPENHHPKFSIITFLNNYELFLLAFVNVIVFVVSSYIYVYLIFPDVYVPVNGPFIFNPSGSLSIIVSAYPAISPSLYIVI